MTRSGTTAPGRGRAVLLALACLIPRVAAADAVDDTDALDDVDDVAERFTRATEALAQGRQREAAEALVAIAEQAPDHERADDSLFAAAKLYEESLGDPARALALYQLLVERYPSSRTALAARRRADTIRRAVGPDASGAQALARFNDILHRFTERDPAESIADVETLLAENPAWPGRVRALAWLASVHQRQGQHERALRRYLDAADAAAAAGGPEAAGDRFQAYRGAGDAALDLGRFDEAEGYYRRLSAAGDPSLEHVVAEAFEQLDRARLRETLYRVAFAVIAVVILGFAVSLRRAAGSFAGAARALVPPPIEVLFMAPIAGLLCAASLTGNLAIAPAVVIMCAGGLAITWLSGAALAAASRAPGATRTGVGRYRAVVHAAAVAVAVVALCYVAVHRNHLIDLIIDTVRFGPDV